VTPFKKFIFSCLGMAMIAIAGADAHAQAPYYVRWMSHLPIAETFSGGIALDSSGQVQIACGTYRSGTGNDALLAQYSASGQLQHSPAFGTTYQDSAYGVACDGAGGIYLTGATDGSLAAPNASGTDGIWNDTFISKFTTSGTQLWTKQFGAPGDDILAGICSDGLGNLYLGGFAHGSLPAPSIGAGDACVARIDASGNLLWARQFGASSSYVGDVSADSLGNVFAAGYDGHNGGFLAKYDANGNAAWNVSFRYQDSTFVNGIAADGLGNVYVDGASVIGGNLASRLAFLNKYDSSGHLLWSNQFGAGQMVNPGGIVIGRQGHVLVCGGTNGSFGAPSAGSSDAFLAEFNPITGTMTWLTQFGSSAYDTLGGITSDAFGNIFVDGTTDGNLAGPYRTPGDNVFVMEFSPVPEPSSVVLIASGVGFLLMSTASNRRPGRAYAAARNHRFGTSRRRSVGII